MNIILPKFQELKDKFNTFTKAKEITKMNGLTGEFEEIVDVLEEKNIEGFTKAIEDGEEAFIKYLDEPLD